MNKQLCILQLVRPEGAVAVRDPGLLPRLTGHDEQRVCTHRRRADAVEVESRVQHRLDIFLPSLARKEKALGIDTIFEQRAIHGYFIRQQKTIVEKLLTRSMNLTFFSWP